MERIFCEIATFSDVNKVLHSCPGFAILVKEVASVPFRSWRDWKNTDLFSAIESNVLADSELIQRILPSMIKNWVEWSKH